MNSNASIFFLLKANSMNYALQLDSEDSLIHTYAYQYLTEAIRKCPYSHKNHMLVAHKTASNIFILQFRLP
jgi:hypothetical protein